MRLLLLFSAFLSALVGAGASERVAAAQTHQAIALAVTTSTQAGQGAKGVPVLVELPGVVAALAAPPATLWSVAPAMPIYVDRLRI